MCTIYETKFWKMKGWGSSRDNEGQPKSFVFLYKYKRVLDRRQPFSRLSWERIVRRTISFYNKESYVFNGEISMDFSNVCYGPVGYEQFLFHLVSINCENVLTHWIFSCYEFALVYFCEISTLSNECFN